MVLGIEGHDPQCHLIERLGQPVVEHEHRAAAVGGLLQVVELQSDFWDLRLLAGRRRRQGKKQYPRARDPNHDQTRSFPL
jgi:hypothetical protein